jgi:hypothetical protein
MLAHIGAVISKNCSEREGQNIRPYHDPDPRPQICIENRYLKNVSLAFVLVLWKKLRDMTRRILQY